LHIKNKKQYKKKDMIILKSLTSNVIKFIARQGTPLTVVLRDEQTKEITNLTPSFSSDGYYTEFTLDEVLVENRKYQMVVISSTQSVLYRGLLHAITNQEIEDYSTDVEKYSTPVESTTTSKYKIIE
tara:strand:+ start:3956 stop:4336 length:381 start_codon:yes stop_codon:yes gene_type:complete